MGWDYLSEWVEWVHYWKWYNLWQKEQQLIYQLWKYGSWHLWHHLLFFTHLHFGPPDPHPDFQNSNYYYQYSLTLLNEHAHKKRLNTNYQFEGQVSVNLNQTRLFPSKYLLFPSFVNSHLTNSSHHNDVAPRGWATIINPTLDSVTHSKSSFQMTIKNDKAIAIAAFSDWLKNLIIANSDYH